MKFKIGGSKIGGSKGNSTKIVKSGGSKGSGSGTKKA